MSLRAVQVYRQLKAVAAFPVQAGPVASSLRYQKKHESICRGELCGSCSGSIQSAGSHETWSLPVLHPSRRPACFISTHVDAGERFVWKPNLQRVLQKREHMGQAHTPYTRSSSSTCAISFHSGSLELPTDIAGSHGKVRAGILPAFLLAFTGTIHGDARCAF